MTAKTDSLCEAVLEAAKQGKTWTIDEDGWAVCRLDIRDDMQTELGGNAFRIYGHLTADKRPQMAVYAGYSGAFMSVEFKDGFLD